MPPRRTPAKSPALAEGADGGQPAAAGGLAGVPQPELSDIPGLGYEQAKQELLDIVTRLESGQVGLEESVALWQRGDALAEHCEAWLTRAEAVIAPERSSPDALAPGAP